MRVLLGVVLIAFVAQASAQARQSLLCFECTDCRVVIRPGTPTRNCYAQQAPPTTQTVPGTIGLTEATTIAGAVVETTESTVQVEVEPNSIDSLSRASPLFKCFTIQRDIGDRRITHRGCAAIHQNDELTCQNENQGENPAACNLCQEDNCNDMSSVSTAVASISLILASLFIATRLN